MSRSLDLEKIRKALCMKKAGKLQKEIAIQLNVGERQIQNYLSRKWLAQRHLTDLMDGSVGAGFGQTETTVIRAEFESEVHRSALLALLVAYRDSCIRRQIPSPSKVISDIFCYRRDGIELPTLHLWQNKPRWDSLDWHMQGTRTWAFLEERRRHHQQYVLECLRLMEKVNETVCNETNLVIVRNRPLGPAAASGDRSVWSSSSQQSGEYLCEELIAMVIWMMEQNWEETRMHNTLSESRKWLMEPMADAYNHLTFESVFQGDHPMQPRIQVKRDGGIYVWWGNFLARNIKGATWLPLRENLKLSVRNCIDSSQWQRTVDAYKELTSERVDIDTLFQISNDRKMLLDERLASIIINTRCQVCAP